MPSVPPVHRLQWESRLLWGKEGRFWGLGERRPQRTAPRCQELGCWSWAPPGTRPPVSRGEHAGSHGRSRLCPPARSCPQRVSVLGLGAWLSSLNVCLFPRTALSPHHGGKALLLCICRCQTLKLGQHVSGLEWPGRRLLPPLDFGNESAWLVRLPSSARYRG